MERITSIYAVYHTYLRNSPSTSMALAMTKQQFCSKETRGLEASNGWFGGFKRVGWRFFINLSLFYPSNLLKTSMHRAFQELRLAATCHSTCHPTCHSARFLIAWFWLYSRFSLLLSKWGVEWQVEWHVWATCHSRFPLCLSAFPASEWQGDNEVAHILLRISTHSLRE